MQLNMNSSSASNPCNDGLHIDILGLFGSNNFFCLALAGETELGNLLKGHRNE